MKVLCLAIALGAAVFGAPMHQAWAAEGDGASATLPTALRLGVPAVLFEDDGAPLTAAEAAERLKTGERIGNIADRGRVAWLSLPLPTSLDGVAGSRWYLFSEVNQLLPRIDAYLAVPGAIIPLGSCGASVPPGTCPEPLQRLAFPFQVPPKAVVAAGETALVLRAETIGVGISPEFKVMAPGTFATAARSSDWIMGAIIAICLFVTLVSGTLFVLLRDRTFVAYSLLYGNSGLAYAINRGLLDTFLPDSVLPWLARVSILVMVGVGVTDMMFVAVILDARRTMPWINRFVVGASGCALALGLASLVPQSRAAVVALIPAIAVATAFVGMVALLAGIRKQLPLARLVGLGWAFDIIGLSIWAGTRAGLLHWVWVDTLSVGIGRICECAVFSFVLVMRFRHAIVAAANAETSERENRIIRVLLRTLSHDLSNTIQVLRTAVYLGKREGASSEVIASTLTRVDAATRQQLDIIRHVKESYLVPGTGALVRTSPVSLASVLKELETLFQGQMERKGLVLESHAPAEDLMVIAERVSLTHQVLANILSNAVKFSPKGRRITVNIETTGTEVTVVVEDEGIGIPASLMESLFLEDGQKSRRGTEGEEGTGYGMPLVKAFTEAYGGWLEVKSPVKGNAGTKVMIHLLRPVVVLRPPAA